MGEGHFGGNGSVQWRVRHHQGAATTRDVGETDPIPMADIGNRHGRRGDFKVTLEYENRAGAEAALGSATVIGNRVVLHVPAVDRSGGQNSGREIEVKVEW